MIWAVITRNEWSALESIYGLFSTKEKADQFLKEVSEKGWFDGCTEVVPWKLDLSFDELKNDSPYE